MCYVHRFYCKIIIYDLIEFMLYGLCLLITNRKLQNGLIKLNFEMMNEYEFDKSDF